ncbi:hypothetical protein SLEP1_g60314, partial [Rubroshorea leprosula]
PPPLCWKFQICSALLPCPPAVMWVWISGHFSAREPPLQMPSASFPAGTGLCLPKILVLIVLSP